MKNYEPVPTDLIEKQFTEFLYSIDGGAYAPSGEFNLILDKKTRYQVEGDKGRKTTGVYMVHSDGYPAGYVINYRISSEPIKWKFDNEVLKADKKYFALYNIMQTPEFKAEAERVRQEREAKEAAEKLKATNKAKAEWDGAQPATDEHAYLKRKNVKSYGLKVNREGALLVDFYNVEQEFKGTQRIFKDGFKPYADGCDKRGAFHIMDGEPIIDKEGIILAEGYATAASIHDCIGSDYKFLMTDKINYNFYHIIMAIDCYNLLPVAKAIKSQYPNVTIIIAADNDGAKHKNTDGKNPGVDRAIECCKAGYAKGYITIDENEINDGLTDWNDYYCKYGRAATKQALIDALRAPLKPVSIEAQAEAQTPNYSDEEIAQLAKEAEQSAQYNDTGDFYGDYDNPQPSEAPVKGITPEADGLSFKEITKLEGRKFLNAIEKCSEIPAGYRDDILLKVAKTALLAHEEGTAYSIFLDAVKKCEPQLGLDQVAKVWKQALKFTAKEKAKTEREAQKAAAKAERDAQREEEKKKLLNNRIVEKFLIQNNISLRLNVISGRVEVDGLPEQSELVQKSFKKLSKAQRADKSTALLSLYLNDAFLKDNYQVNYKILRERLSSIASSNEFNPVKEMLEGVTWDGQNRIESLAEILNITLARQAVTLLKKWLVQTVAMAFNEGRTALEFCLTLKGKQGCGKTTFFRVISMVKEHEEFFQEGAILDIRDKDTIIKATSAWICELGEVDATLRKEQSNLKAFLTNTHDDYRRPYAENYEHKPRRTSFCATVNDDRFLRDLTGNRRWAVIEIDKIDKKALRVLSTEWLMQMWRQAYELYLNDNNYFRLTDEELNALEQENKKSIVLLPGETELYDLLNWDAPVNEWTYTTATEILRRLDIKNIDAQKIGYVLKKIARQDERIVKKHGKYGSTYLLPPKK